MPEPHCQPDWAQMRKEKADANDIRFKLSVYVSKGLSNARQLCLTSDL
jgi:hypothetical protein